MSSGAVSISSTSGVYQRARSSTPSQKPSPSPRSRILRNMRKQYHSVATSASEKAVKTKTPHSAYTSTPPWSSRWKPAQNELSRYQQWSALKCMRDSSIARELCV